MDAFEAEVEAKGAVKQLQLKQVGSADLRAEDSRLKPSWGLRLGMENRGGRAQGGT